MTTRFEVKDDEQGEFPKAVFVIYERNTEDSRCGRGSGLVGWTIVHSCTTYADASRLAGQMDDQSKDEEAHVRIVRYAIDGYWP